MSDDAIQTCIVCGFAPVKIKPNGRDGHFIKCPNCGDFELSRTTYAGLSAKFEMYPNGPIQLSHAIRKRQKQKGNIFIGGKDVVLLIENTPIPKPQEQADNLVLWLGKLLNGLGDSTPYNPQEMIATIGAWNETNVTKLVESLKTKGLVILETGNNRHEISLTMEGWERYHHLERGVVENRMAFMAMPYGNELLDRVYQECFKPAVRDTGFDLLRLDETPMAGLIDNRMRALIRAARFLVVDLTSENRGAYWEAGFAEGLGRPVLYTCERDYFDENKTHFDTNHCHTVLWSKSDLDHAAQNLSATIRETFPAEAILEGD